MKILVVLIAAINAIVTAVPTENVDKAILFKYQADFRTGVLGPHIYGSQFVLKADLHGQYLASSHTGIFYFSNVLVSLNNGIVPMEGPTNNEHFLPSLETISLEKPFLIEYPDGAKDINAIFTESSEPKWILNIKKSVASLFQFDWETFDLNENNTVPYTFHSEENGIYGKCLVSYTVEPKDNEFTVNKHYNPSECSHFKQHTVTNLIEKPCNNFVVQDDNFNMDNRRTYHIERNYNNNNNDNSRTIFKKIEAAGKVFFFPFREIGETKFANVIQTVEFVNYEEIKEIIFDVKIKHDIEFDINYNSETEILSAITFSLKTDNLDDPNVTNVKKCVNGIVNLSENITDAGAYHYAIATLSYFTADELDLCAKYLISNYSSKFVKVFYEIVPILGTRASANFIKNVIKTHKIKSSVAISLVQYFPFYVLVPSEELLVDLQEFIAPDFEVKPNIKSAAILAYATLISRTYKIDSDSTVLAEYIDTFYNHLKSAQTYAEQLLWFQALKNINTNYVFKLMLPIIRGEQILDLQYNHHLQIVAIINSYRLIKDNQIELNNALWPIIINRQAHPELRVSAIWVYLNGIKTVREISNIFWYMQTETNSQVFNFFKTSIETIADSSKYCENALTTYAKHAMSYMKNFGSDSEMYSFAYDNIEKEYNLGGTIHGLKMADKDNKPTSYLVSIDGYALRKSVNLLTFYIRRGIKNEFINHPLDFLTSHDVEFIVKINHKAISVNVCSWAEVKELVKKTISYNEFVKINDFFNTDTIIPTDIGLPLTMHFKMPVITQVKLTENIPSVVFKLQQTLLGNYGVSIYNPYANVWLGSTREVRYNINIPVTFDLNLLTGNVLFTTMDQYKNGNNFEFSHILRTVSYITHPSNSSILTDYCSNCKFYQSITSFYDEKKNYEETITLKEIGLDINLQVSDCTGSYDGTSYSNSVKNKLYNEENIKYLNKTYWPKFVIYLINYAGLKIISPKVHSCTENITITSNNFYPVEEISINFNYKNYFNNNLTEILTPSITIVTHNETKLWESNITFNTEHQLNVEISKTVEGQLTYNLCFDHQKLFINEMVTGKFNWYEGYADKKECVRDDFSVNIEWEGQHSDEQHFKNQTTKYVDCAVKSDYLSMTPILSIDCIKAHTTLRNYTYNVQYKNMPINYQNYLKTIRDTVMNSLYHYNVHYHVEQNLERNNFKIELIQPTNYDDTFADVKIITDELTYTYNHINYYNLLFPLDNTHFNKKLQNACVIEAKDNLDKNGNLKHPINEYYRATIETKNNIENIVEVKYVDDQYLAINITIGLYSIEVMYNNSPDSEKFIYHKNVMMKSALESSENYHGTGQNQLNPYNIKIQIIKDTFVFITRKPEMFVMFDGKYLKTFSNYEGFYAICNPQLNWI